MATETLGRNHANASIIETSNGLCLRVVVLLFTRPVETATRTVACPRHVTSRNYRDLPSSRPLMAASLLTKIPEVNTYVQVSIYDPFPVPVSAYIRQIAPLM